MYDELDLDMLGDERTALFLIMSDTDGTFAFLISLIYSILFNRLCERADDVYGGRLPIHVTCINLCQRRRLQRLPKNKQQEAQEKRLQKNIRQAKKTRADAKQGKTKSARSKPSKKGGFFAGLKADAPQTVQQSIPYREMYRDGICRLTDTLYTKTVQFFDINYQLAQADDKAQIFEGYCDFLNYFDASIHVQLTFINQRANMQDFTRSIDIPPRGDEYDGIRREYGDMLKNQLQKGNNGLTKRKYITFGIEADDLRTAKMRLERIETDVLANFKTLGVQARSLNGLERLELLHSQLHPDGQEKFHFQWSDLPKTGLSTKDFISPSGLSFSKDGKTFRVGDHSGAVSFLQILAPELTDRLLADLLDLNDAVTVNLHIQSIDQAQAIRNIKRKMSDLQKMTIEEQKKAVRSGYDMDIIPTDLATYGEEAKNLLQDLQSRNERMFLVTVLVENIAAKRQKLFNDIFAASGVAQKYNCALKRLDYQQEQGLMSSLALGTNQIEIERGLTTSSTAIFVPFTTCELFQEGEALYGHNMRDGSMFALLNRYDEQSYFDTHRQMYLVTPKGGYVMEIFTAFAAKPEESGSKTSPWQLSWKDDGAYTTWLTAMKERSAVESDVTVTCSDKVLTLSTCTPGGTGRFLVMGKLVKVDNEI